MPSVKVKAHFIEPMLLQPTGNLPQTGSWFYELKLDGYRSVAIKSGGRVQLRSRNDKDFNGRYPAIVKALAAMPDETVIDVKSWLWMNRVGHHSPRCRTTAPAWQKCSITYST